MRASPLHLEIGSQGRVLPRASFRGGQGIWKEGSRGVQDSLSVPSGLCPQSLGKSSERRQVDLAHSFTNTFTHSLMHSLMCSFSSTHTHSPINLLTHSYIHFPIQLPPPIHLLSHSFTPGVRLIHFPIHSRAHPLCTLLSTYSGPHPSIHPPPPFSHPLFLLVTLPSVCLSGHYLSIHLPTYSLTNSKWPELQTLQRNQPPPA